MPDLRVVEVLGTGEPWSTKDGKGPFIPYRFKVEGNARLIEWSRKEGSAGPSVGDVLQGELQDKGESYPLKFKKAQQNSREFGYQTHPVDAARMGRCHAQDMAMQYIAVKAQLGATTDFTLPQVFSIADAFEEDVLKAKP